MDTHRTTRPLFLPSQQEKCSQPAIIDIENDDIPAVSDLATSTTTEDVGIR
jgi:hypothetical protein